MAAFRRRTQVGTTDSPYSYNYDLAPPPDSNASASSASSLATKAIRASAAYRDSSLSSAYEQHSSVSSPRRNSSTKEPSLFESTQTNMNESKQGFWGALARKAKAILDDEDDDDNNGAQPREMPEGTRLQTSERTKKGPHHNPYISSETHRKTDSSSIKKGLGVITSSLNTIGNALEEGIMAVENRTAEIIQETRKTQLKKKSGSSISQSQGSKLGSLRQRVMQTNTDLEMQLKASRDVRWQSKYQVSMAMAAKAKLLLRELKTVKADLAFAKERCGQLEEENRMLRESRRTGHNLEDDDLVRLQLESLLTEKSRLALENSVCARENRFLREIVEYHQLTMQDLVYFDEGNEEVTQVYPIKIVDDTQSVGTVSSSSSPIPTVPKGAISQVTRNRVSNVSIPSLEFEEAFEIICPANPYVQKPAQDSRH
ncbi:hypothetical protein PHJA_000194700 [Phtheirospermum japonicum]|uniref:Uncharacterized protein n=1 Tax=Phtheirospermum japonicum TaxID=374723 RepID=A0A830B7N5_9LAMI|nr:hypothetical protein PHJA_000194700 [Phtheirospermum japonicum]